jgi:hypothetical protein
MKPQTQTILRALLRGEVLTNELSKQRYSVEALSQRCGEINRDPTLPDITSVRVKGKSHNEHYIEGLRRTNLPAPEGRRVQVVAHTRRIGCAVDDQPSLFGGAS